MRRSEIRKVVAAYVADRLRRECAKRGTAAEIARAVHFTRVHVAAVARGDNAAGDDFCDAMAGYWGITRAQLDKAAAAWADENGVDVSGPRGTKSGRLRERPEWGDSLAAAKAVFRGIPDEYFERVGMVFDDVPERIDAQFIGEMARILYDLTLREEHDPPASTVSLAASRPDLPCRKTSKG